MRERFEIEHLPVVLERSQRPQQKRGFLIRLLRLFFPKLMDSCACSCGRSSRGEEVEELRVIEF